MAVRVQQLWRRRQISNNSKTCRLNILFDAIHAPYRSGSDKAAGDVGVCRSNPRDTVSVSAGHQSHLRQGCRHTN